MDRLARVLDAQSADYVSEMRRQRDMAQAREQELIDAGFLTKPLGKNTPEDIAAAVQAKAAFALTGRQDVERKRGVEAETDALRLRRMKQEADDYRSRDQLREQELVDAGYLTKPVGRNTPEEIAAAENSKAVFAQGKRANEQSIEDFNAWKRGKEKDSYRSPQRQAKEQVVENSLVPHTKAPSDMSDAELDAAYSAAVADVIERAGRGEKFADGVQEQVAAALKDLDGVPTEADVARAKASLGRPRSMSQRDLAEWEQQAMQLAQQAAQGRQVVSMRNLKYLRGLQEQLAAKGRFPTANPLVAPGTTPGGTTPGTTQASDSDISGFGNGGPGKGGPGGAPAALSPLEAEVNADAAAEEAARKWPEIAALFQTATTTDDALRQKIAADKTVMRSKPASLLQVMAASPYGNPFYVDEPVSVAPTAVEKRDSLADEMQKIAAARASLSAFGPQARAYRPSDPAQAAMQQQIIKFINSLTPPAAAAK